MLDFCKNHNFFKDNILAYLIFVTILWAFSFPLIGYFVSGAMDSFFAAFFRVFLAFLVFLPSLDFRTPNALKLALMGVGALQIGIMYLFYYHSFLYLSVSEVALFTIFTPFYVSVVYDIFSKKFRAMYLLSIAICVFGAFVIKFDAINPRFLTGFVLIQLANFAFGTGQSLYKIIVEKEGALNQRGVFGYFHLGAMIVTAIAFLALGAWNLPATPQSWAVLIYLGVVASGVGYFLWNKGAVCVDSGVLAIMNNALIPTAIVADALLVAVFFPEKSVDFSTNEMLRIALGTSIMLFSLWLHYKIIRQKS